MKSPVKSKTLWVNLILAVVAFFPGLADKISADQVLLGMGVVNMILRLVTKDAIGLE